MTADLDLLAALEAEARRPVPPSPQRKSSSREATLEARVKELQAKNRKLTKAMTALKQSHGITRDRLKARIAELEQRAFDHRCGYRGRILP